MHTNSKLKKGNFCFYKTTELRISQSIPSKHLPMNSKTNSNTGMAHVNAVLLLWSTGSPPANP